MNSLLLFRFDPLLVTLSDCLGSKQFCKSVYCSCWWIFSGHALYCAVIENQVPLIGCFFQSIWCLRRLSLMTKLQLEGGVECLSSTQLQNFCVAVRRETVQITERHPLTYTWN
jgi:hypothetical protein